MRPARVLILVAACGTARTPQAPAPAAAPALEVPGTCAAPTRDGVCDCLIAGVEREDPENPPTCQYLDGELATPQDVAIARVDESFNQHAFHLVVEGPRGWSVAGVVAQLFDGGLAGIHNDLEWDTIEERRVGGARLLWIETVETGHDHDEMINESESHETRVLTLCVLDGPRGDPPSCPLQVPLSWEYGRDILMEENEAALTDEARQRRTPGLPIRQERRLAVALGADGTATVTLVRGEATPDVAALLGTHTIVHPR